MRNPNRKRKPKHMGNKGHKKISVIYFFLKGTYVIQTYKFNKIIKCTKYLKGERLENI